jgi:hypothetical protein
MLQQDNRWSQHHTTPPDCLNDDILMLQGVSFRCVACCSTKVGKKNWRLRAMAGVRRTPTDQKMEPCPRFSLSTIESNQASCEDLFRKNMSTQDFTSTKLLLVGSIIKTSW